MPAVAIRTRLPCARAGSVSPQERSHSAALAGWSRYSCSWSICIEPSEARDCCLQAIDFRPDVPRNYAAKQRESIGIVYRDGKQLADLSPVAVEHHDAIAVRAAHQLELLAV